MHLLQALRPREDVPGKSSERFGGTDVLIVFFLNGVDAFFQFNGEIGVELGSED